MAVRLSLLSAGLWWAAFTLIPYADPEPTGGANVVPSRGGLVRQSFGQLFATLRDAAATR